MTPQLDGLPLTFDAVLNYLSHRQSFKGPFLPLTNYKFVAGILFEHDDDHSVRRLYTPLGETPFIVVNFILDFQNSYLAPVLITNTVVTVLAEQQLIESSGGCWKLSIRGAQCVTKKWFKDTPRLDDLPSVMVSLTTSAEEATTPLL